MSLDLDMLEMRQKPMKFLERRPLARHLRSAADIVAEFIGQAPDWWGSVITYASLEMLEEAIKRHGLDRDAVSKELSTGTFQTVLGETKLENNQLRDLWFGGQWQDGNFVAVAPSDREGAVAPKLPKAPWPAQ